jgi:hypothetical protein
MHLPSAELRQELLSAPSFARFVKSRGSNGFETTLILKGATLTLKYLIRRGQLSILIEQLASGEILYAILIDEYDDKPAAVWSLVESEEEFSALADLAKIQSFTLFLFNEAGVNVCWANVHFELLIPLESIIRNPLVFSSRIKAQEDTKQVETALNAALSGRVSSTILQTKEPLKWNEITNHYITNQLVVSPIGILTENEGDQQEELCTWLLDNLSPSGAHRGPRVQEERQERELTDVLISYPGGCFLIESKTLAVLERDELPPRPRLRKNVLKNIKKALSQLPGACRNIRAGLQVTSASGKIIPINSGMPPHCIVLVPELSLLTSEDGLGGDLLMSFLKQHRAYLHILDPSELMDMMRAAGHIAFLGKKTSKMMAFDSMLIERWQKAVSLDSPDFRLIVHFV